MRLRVWFQRQPLHVKLITSYLVILGVGGVLVTIVGSWMVSAAMQYVGVQEGAYTAARNRVIFSFVVIEAIAFALIIGITFLLIKSMTQPIGRMVAATQRIAAGNLGTPVEVDPADEGEMAVLARSFNTMLHALRRMRSDLEAWGSTLEQRVRERTDELARMQTRVAESERLASIGMLAAGVAHEINNPLGGIMALTALTLEDLPESDPNRENLAEVVRQCERCRDIVRHLLEFSRQSAVNIEEVDVNALLEKTLALLERQSIFFNIDVQKELAPELPPVQADRSQLQQVFMNILLNAVQAMDERGTLTLSTEHHEDSAAIEVVFRDTGHGIAPEHAPRVFDPFFTTKEAGRGTGLGLSIAYGIISRHGGTISIDSEPGTGTTFTVRLPAAAPVLVA